VRKLFQELEQAKQEKARLARENAIVENFKSELAVQKSALAMSDQAKDDLQKAHDALVSELKGIPIPRQPRVRSFS